MFTLRALITLCMLLGSIPQTVAITTPSPTNTASPNPMWGSIVTRLKAQTRVPIFLPDDLRISPTERDSAGKIYLYAAAFGGDSYVVSFDRTPDCHNTGYCSDSSLLSTSLDLGLDPKYFDKISYATPKNGSRAFIGREKYKGNETKQWIFENRQYILTLGVDNFPSDLIVTANSMRRY